MGVELAKCQKMGLCKAVGISNFSKDQTYVSHRVNDLGIWLIEVRRIEMANVLEKEGVKLASNQVEYSLLRQLPETSGLLEECKKRDIALLACTSAPLRCLCLLTVRLRLPSCDG
jgi:diketogulonate reductase-like aldo/keto reductase